MLNPAKKFEVENVSKILTETDTIIHGNIPSFVSQLVESANVVSGHIKKKKIEVSKYFDSNDNENVSFVEVDLLNARLLSHVGAWDKIQQYYDKVFASFADNNDELHKLKIEYAERIIPTKPEDALNLIEDLERNDVQPQTKAYALATKSNILRRLKRLEESKVPIDEAVRISEKNLVDLHTKHLVNFYKALWIHLDMANKIRNAKDFSKQLMSEIMAGEELFRNNISYFEKEGSFDLAESNKNGLSLILLEKAKHLKLAKKDEESTEELSNAVQILENISQIRVRYGYFRGAGQACRNIALVHIENQKYEDALQALTKSEQFYKFAKPFPQSDVDEVYYRYAEVYEKMGEHSKVFDPIMVWIRQKRLEGDWHNETRGLFILIKALKETKAQLKMTKTIETVLNIYDKQLLTITKKEEFLHKPYAKSNALEIINFILTIKPLDPDIEYRLKKLRIIINNLI